MYIYIYIYIYICGLPHLPRLRALAHVGCVHERHRRGPVRGNWSAGFLGASVHDKPISLLLLGGSPCHL